MKFSGMFTPKKTLHRRPPMHKPMTVEDKKKKANREACRRLAAISDWSDYER